MIKFPDRYAIPYRDGLRADSSPPELSDEVMRAISRAYSHPVVPACLCARSL